MKLLTAFWQSGLCIAACIYHLSRYRQRNQHSSGWNKNRIGHSQDSFPLGVWKWSGNRTTTTFPWTAASVKQGTMGPFSYLAIDKLNLTTLEHCMWVDAWYRLPTYKRWNCLLIILSVYTSNSQLAFRRLQLSWSAERMKAGFSCNDFAYSFTLAGLNSAHRMNAVYWSFLVKSPDSESSCESNCLLRKTAALFRNPPKTIGAKSLPNNLGKSWRSSEFGCSSNADLRSPWSDSSAITGRRSTTVGIPCGRS